MTETILRKSSERGFFDFGWLKTFHTFSFGDYYDPAFMGFRNLRVINEDRVQAGEGFPTHPHQDMEILTYVVSGSLAHKDSMGNGASIHPSEVQRMSAGTGVTHSEFNGSKEEAVHLLQIWILPAQKGLNPSYEQNFFGDELKKNKLCLIASDQAEAGSVLIHQDVKIFSSLLDQNQSLEYAGKKDRAFWLQVVKGEVKVDENILNSGDAYAHSFTESLRIRALENSEFLLFDLA